MNAVPDLIQRIESTVNYELALLEAQQPRHVDVGPDEEMSIEILWSPAAAAKREQMNRILLALAA